jgi:hypothetical protein
MAVITGGFAIRNQDNRYDSVDLVAGLPPICERAEPVSPEIAA